MNNTYNKLTLKQVFTDKLINHYKDNKEEITEKLLETLRAHGNEGKALALEILDIHQDEEAYYLDAFGNRISQNGNRMLKKPLTKLNLALIHKIELAKCAKDIHYYMNNYVKIRTPKGINFVDPRPYQNDFIDIISDDENESIVSLQPRQSGKSVTVGIYLSHVAIFDKDMDIGIAANKSGMAQEFLDKTKNILISLPIWMQQGVKVWNKTYIEFENKIRIMSSATSQDSFRGFTCNIVVVDETAFIRPSMWDEFADAIFPSQSGLAFKKTILISTANGLNHFYNYIDGARKETNGFLNYEVDWKDVPRYNADGTQKLPEDFQTEIIAKYGIIYWNQNYGNDFIGSSHTLLSADTLKSLEPKEPEIILDQKLKVYHKPVKGHQYIMSVDPAKDGKDAFAVQVMDVTNFQFKQVASAQLDIDYLLMPEFINEWCEYYYNPFLIIENNEGAGQSVADQMYQTYEYENLYFDKKTETTSNNIAKSKKKYPGFRTTTKSRKQILQTMKTFIENDNLEINDNETIKEFFTFILENGKYQADEGTHDDAIMSLAIIFAPFNNTKNFHDMKEISKLLFQDHETDKPVEISEIFSIGGFDDGVYENDNHDNIYKPESKEYTNYEEYLYETQDGFY